MSANNYFAVCMGPPVAGPPDPKMDPEDLSMRVLTEVVTRLRDKGLNCTNIGRGSFCWATTCLVADAKVGIVAIDSIEKLPDGSLCFSMWCRNHVPIPWWRKLIPFGYPLSPQMLDTGEALELVCDAVEAALRSIEWAPAVKVMRLATLKEWEAALGRNQSPS